MNIDTFHKMLESATLIVERGSVVYQTLTMYSDRDMLVVVPDEYKPITESGKNGIVEYISPSPSVDVTNNDYQFVCESDFQRMIDDCTVLAIETLCTPIEHVLYTDTTKHKFKAPLYKWNNCTMFDFDKWKVRQQFSTTASNSWAKAHKKMTVEKDLDMYRGQKSLFHSLRILMFANQVCRFGYITDFHEARDLWYEIYDPLNKSTWEDYKAKYKPLYNKLHSELAVLSPKPVETQNSHIISNM